MAKSKNTYRIYYDIDYIKILYLNFRKLREELIKKYGFVNKQESPEIYEKMNYVMVGKHRIRFDSQRYELFFTSPYSPSCNICGIGGATTYLEKFPNEHVYHINVYGRRGKKEVMLTKDHIIPKAKGGADIMSNYQILCFDCNQEKSDEIWFCT